MSINLTCKQWIRYLIGLSQCFYKDFSFWHVFCIKGLSYSPEIKMRNIIAACVLLTAASAASASVVYNWETLSTSPTIASAVGQIEISDDAFAAGQGSYAAAYSCGSNYSGCGDASSPIVSFYFRVNSANPTGSDIDLNLVDGSGTMWPLQDWFNATYSVNGNELLLDVFASTGETDMRMDANAITRFGSDAPYFGYACFSGGCSGATGRWVQEAGNDVTLEADVPEPGSVFLLGIGTVAALLACRRGKTPAPNVA